MRFGKRIYCHAIKQSMFCIATMEGPFAEIRLPLTYFFKWANLGLFFIYFHHFKQTLQFLQQINVKKCPSSIGRRELNSQPSDYKSPPLTTRPGLPPLTYFLCGKAFHRRLVVNIACEDAPYSRHDCRKRKSKLLLSCYVCHSL